MSGTDWRGIAMAFAQLRDLAEPGKIELMEKEYELRAAEQEKAQAFRAAETQMGLLKEDYIAKQKEIDDKTEIVEEMNAGALKLLNSGEEFVSPAFSDITQGLDLSSIDDLVHGQNVIQDTAEKDLQYLSELTNLTSNMKYGKSLRESLGGDKYREFFADADGGYLHPDSTPDNKIFYTAENADSNSPDYVEGVKSHSWDLNTDTVYEYGEYEKGLTQILNMELEATRDENGVVHPDELQGIVQGFWSGEKGSEIYITQKSEDDKHLINARGEEIGDKNKKLINNLFFSAEWEEEYGPELLEEGYITYLKNNEMKLLVDESLITKKINEIKERLANEAEQAKIKKLTKFDQEFDDDKDGILDVNETKNRTNFLDIKKKKEKATDEYLANLKQYGGFKRQVDFNSYWDDQEQKRLYDLDSDKNNELWQSEEETMSIIKQFNKLESDIRGYQGDNIFNMGGKTRDGASILNSLSPNAQIEQAYGPWDSGFWESIDLLPGDSGIMDDTGPWYTHGTSDHQSPFDKFFPEQFQHGGSSYGLKYAPEIEKWAEDNGYTYVLEGFTREFEMKLKNFNFTLSAVSETQNLQLNIAAAETFNFIVKHWNNYLDAGSMGAGYFDGDQISPGNQGFMTDENKDGVIDRKDFTELIFRFKSTFGEHFESKERFRQSNWFYKISGKARNEDSKPNSNKITANS